MVESVEIVSPLVSWERLSGTILLTVGATIALYAEVATALYCVAFKEIDLNGLFVRVSILNSLLPTHTIPDTH